MLNGIEALRKAQDEDDIITEVKSFVKQRRRIPHSFPEPWYVNNSRWLIMQKGILYRKCYAESIHAQTLQAVIPHTMRQEVMNNLHGDYLAGHPGLDKMLLKLKRYAIWPTIAKDVAKFIENCKVCDQIRDPNPHNLTPRIPLEAQNVWDWGRVCQCVGICFVSCIDLGKSFQLSPGKSY